MRLDPQARPFMVLGAIVAVVGSVVAFHPGTSHFQADGLPFSFDYPSSWTANPHLVSGFVGPQRLVEVGTVPWPDCAAGDVNCMAQEPMVRPGEIRVSVESYVPRTSICFSASHGPPVPTPNVETAYYRVDRFPATYTREVVAADPYLRWGNEEVWEWTIEGPQYDDPSLTSPLVPVFVVRATFSATGALGFRLALNQLADSFHVYGDLLPENTCGTPFPPVG